MLAAILKQKDNNYYVDITVKDKALIYNVVLANNKEIRNLTKEEAKQLLLEVIGGKKEFKEMKDDYRIYIDEAGNQRFFKNGRESFVKFFKNNGQSALLYMAKDRGENSRVKRFNLVGKNMGEIVAIASMIILISAIDVNANTIFDQNYYDGTKKVTEINLEIDDVDKFINESKGNITEEQKDYLYNKEFIEDVLSIADDSRNYILRKKIKNITIEYGGEEFEGNNMKGYYSPLEPNCIHLRDDSKEIADSVLAHEFIHLMQDDNEYLYIREVSADMMAHEYYGVENLEYVSECNNIQILMEMIGPKPIMELSFKGDAASFKQAIYEQLGKEKGDRLLELFKISPFDEEVDMKEVNHEIRSLLDEMSYSMYGMKLEDSNNLILKSTMCRKTYFNQHSADYYEEYLTSIEADSTKQIDFKDVDFSEVTEYELIIAESITKEEYENLEKQESDEFTLSTDSLWNCSHSYVKTDEQTGEDYYEVNNEVISKTEAIEKGYLERKYYKNYSKKCSSYDELKKECTNNRFIQVSAKVNDGTVMYFLVNNGIESDYATHTVPQREEKIESLAEKFPDQLIKTSSIVAQEIINGANEVSNIAEEAVKKSR